MSLKSVSNFPRAIQFVAFLFILQLPSQTGFARELERLVVETEAGKLDFFVEIADTAKSREIGLMYRKSLPANQGMLFIYDREQQIRFWMRNTPIPLDMIFVSNDGVIKFIHHNAEPYSLTSVGPKQPVRFVLEINGDLSRKLAIKVGDKVQHRAIAN